MKSTAQKYWEGPGVVTVQRPDAPRDTRTVFVYDDKPLSEKLLTAKMLLEMRRKILDEATGLREYAKHAHNDPVRRICISTAERLEDIIGGAPV